MLYYHLKETVDINTFYYCYCYYGFFYFFLGYKTSVISVNGGLFECKRLCCIIS